MYARVAIWSCIDEKTQCEYIALHRKIICTIHVILGYCPQEDHLQVVIHQGRGDRAVRGLPEQPPHRGQPRVVARPTGESMIFIRQGGANKPKESHQQSG